MIALNTLNDVDIIVSRPILRVTRFCKVKNEKEKTNKYSNNAIEGLQF
jgi:hypothetical protein